MKRLILSVWLLSACLGFGQPFALSIFSPGFLGEDSTLNVGLVAHYNLDETSGTRAALVGGVTLDDNNTVTSGTGVKGNSAFFTRANAEALSAPSDGVVFSIGNIDCTFTLWVKLTSLQTCDIVGKWGGASIEYDLLYNAGTTRFEWYVSGDGVGNASVAASNFGAPSTGTWYFILLEHDSVGNTIKISINNGTANSTAHTTGIFDGTQNFVLGNGVNSSLDGEIDEFRLYKRKLTTAEITALAANPPP